MPAWVSYSILRVLAFVVPFVVLMLLQIEWWLAAVLSAIIGLCVSYIFLRTQREAVSRKIYTARHGEVHRTDDETEDAIVDTTPASGTPDQP